MQPAHWQTDGLRLNWVERMQHEVAPFCQNNHRNRQRDQPCRPQIIHTNPQHVAKQDMVQMHICADLGIHYDAQPKHP